MPRFSARNCGFLLLAALAAACSGDDRGPIDPQPPTPVTPTEPAAPAVQREMRGLWVATVGNIDWPTRTTLTADQQRAELVDILTRAAATGINTIVFQVRPAGDAVYPSSLEPWASLLTGTQGNDPGYDPLAFAIEQAHARGMELHAWINPFRAGNTRDTARLARSHLFNTRRDLVRVYGTQIWMDPGEPEVHEHSLRVVADIVRRYDIDAIHADDYFYPYLQRDATGRLIAFPDSATYARYGAGLARDDWRRANVDRFIERLYREVHAIKPRIKVGISPFGIWRPNNPVGVQGLDSYTEIFADSRKWLQQGWVDYLAPQLYWQISAPQQSYPALLDWWIQQNTHGRHLWPGLAAYRIYSGSTPFRLQEIPDQIRLTRQRSGSTGQILYNTTATLKTSASVPGALGALAATLAGDLYREAALVPASPWLDPVPPPAPSVTVSGGTLQIAPGTGEPARWWAVRRRASGSWTSRVLFGDQRTMALDAGVDRVLVQAVDQAGNLSPAAEWRRP